MKVLIGVGTDVHPFDRLVGWAQRWAESHPDDQVVVQHGKTAPPVGVECAPLFSRDEMMTRFAEADAVVVSCGPGAVMDVRANGRRPVVVARDAARGEHVDDHQQSFARHLERSGLARSIETEDEFVAALDEIRNDPAAWRIEPESRVPEGIERIGTLIDDLVRGR